MVRPVELPSFLLRFFFFKLEIRGNFPGEEEGQELGVGDWNRLRWWHLLRAAVQGDGVEDVKAEDELLQVDSFISPRDYVALTKRNFL